MRAYLNLRYSEGSRVEAFQAGLRALGYQVLDGFTREPNPDDVLVTWNCLRGAKVFTKVFERAGANVLVAENATWGNGFLGGSWLHMARKLHNTADMATYFGPERFDGLKVELAPWRTSGETVILAQRGIGCKPVAMPAEFMREMMKRRGCRIRKHPGRDDRTPIEKDLAHCAKVITWGSGGAIKALQMGIEVESHYPRWIGAQDNSDHGRLEMFRRLAWAQWTLDEIKSGEAFKRLIE